ncbi:MAG: hypothetical protein AAF488_13325, partial [Planctomycetota bacterium]
GSSTTWIEGLHLLFLSALLFGVIDRAQFRSKCHTVMLSWPQPTRVAFWSVIALTVLLVQRSESSPFIYFQF